MLGTQIINRYNALLIKFADNPEFLELIALARNYYDICNVEHGNKIQYIVLIIHMID